MRRRHVLFASGVGLVSGLAGCLEEHDVSPDGTDEEADTPDESGDELQDVSVPERALETGESTIEAIAAGDVDEAASYAPADHTDVVDREEWERVYRDIWLPDAVHGIEPTENTPLDADTPDLFEDGTVDEEYWLEYELELETKDRRYDQRVSVLAYEIDGEWYAWYDGGQPFRPDVDASVDLDREGLETVEITLADRNTLTTVFVRGDGIDAPDTYRLQEVGETRVLTTDDLEPGSYEIVAAIDAPDESGSRVLETVELTDPSEWAGIEEVVLEATVPGWVGREPHHVEDVTNPTLVLERGREYTITVENGDGAIHTLQFRDENEEIVDDYETAFLEEVGGKRELTITATEKLDHYVCEPHQMTMRGEIVVVDSLDN